jgi:hypothetical protein
MEYLLAWVVGLTLFFALVFALFFLITRGTRAIIGPRRRLEEELGQQALRSRLARVRSARWSSSRRSGHSETDRISRTSYARRREGRECAGPGDQVADVAASWSEVGRLTANARKATPEALRGKSCDAAPQSPLVAEMTQPTRRNNPRSPNAAKRRPPSSR